MLLKLRPVVLVLQVFGLFEHRSTKEKPIEMGEFYRAGTGKNKKVIEISPLMIAFWPESAKE